MLVRLRVSGYGGQFSLLKITNNFLASQLVKTRWLSKLMGEEHNYIQLTPCLFTVVDLQSQKIKRKYIGSNLTHYPYLAKWKKIDYLQTQSNK